ncbi:MAG: YdbL family protein [Gammaproteobacteria bacterium]
MKKFSIIGALFLTACVTINIYFPAAAAEKVADEIIKGIQETPAGSAEPKASRDVEDLAFYRWIDGVLNVLVPPVSAAEADLDVDTAEIRSIRAGMKKRFGSLLPFYQSGAIGIGADGLLTVKDSGQVSLKDRNLVNKMVAAENGDREKLYRAIANANGHPDWYDDIKSTFAGSWVKNAESGWWYQKSNGSWQRK